MTQLQEREEREEGRERDDREEREDGGAGTERRILTASPLIWVLLAAAVGWAIWATVGASSKSPIQGARAIVVTTGAKARTVLTLPCPPSGGSSSGGGSGGSSGAKAPDAASLPARSGTRVVIVPGCGGSGSSGVVTRGLIVLPSGSPVPKQSSSSGISSVFVVPRASSAATVVVPRCAGSKGSGSKGPAPLAPAGGGMVVAPPCGSGGG